MLITRGRPRGDRLRLAAVSACAALTMSFIAAPSASGQTGGLTLAAADGNSVRYGQALDLSGRASAPGAAVRLEYAPRAGQWRALRQTVAGAGGQYRFTLRPTRSGAFRTVTPEGVSEVRTVSVIARLAGRASRHVRAGDRVRVRGRLAPGFGGRRVRLQLATGTGWRTVDRTLTGRGGRYRAAWRASGSGRYRLRVKFAGDGRNSAVSRPLGGRVYVYRPSFASWYGPGLYGNPLGCGGTLGYGTVGVAHKTLPCGTKVTFRLHGRSITVPVVDRGPYVGGREFDLTAATKQKLGFGSTGTVWVAH